MSEHNFHETLSEQIRLELARLPQNLSVRCGPVRLLVSADLHHALVRTGCTGAYRLLILLNSVVSLIMDGRVYTCKPGQVFMMAPGQRCLYPGASPLADPTEKRRCIILTIEQTLMEQLRSFAGTGAQNRDAKIAICRLPPDNPGRLSSRALCGLLELCNDRQPGCQEAISLQARLIALQIWRDVSPGPVKSSRQFPLPEVVPDRLAESFRFMQHHLNEPLTDEQLAADAGWSKSHYIRIFGRHFGKSPHQMLTLLRLQQARELLQDTDLTVREVCDCCGFHSASHFAACFRRETGYLPRRYRSHCVAEPLIKPVETATNSCRHIDWQC